MEHGSSSSGLVNERVLIIINDAGNEIGDHLIRVWRAMIWIGTGQTTKIGRMEEENESRL